MIWSLAGLVGILEKVSIESLEYHSRRGDLSLWAKTSLGDPDLAEKISKSSRLRGEKLRERLIKAARSALPEAP